MVVSNGLRIFDVRGNFKSMGNWRGVSWICEGCLENSLDPSCLSWSRLAATTQS